MRGFPKKRRPKSLGKAWTYYIYVDPSTGKPARLHRARMSTGEVLVDGEWRPSVQDQPDMSEAYDFWPIREADVIGFREKLEAPEDEDQ